MTTYVSDKCNNAECAFPYRFCSNCECNKTKRGKRVLRIKNARELYKWVRDLTINMKR